MNIARSSRRTKGNLGKISAALLLALVAGSCAESKDGASTSSSHRDGASSRTIFVSVTAKGEATRFFNRFATATQQVVVSRSPVAGALKSYRLDVSASERLMLVELQADAPAAFPGERLRVEGAALVAVPAGRDPHDFLGSHTIHAEDLGEREVVQGAPSDRLERSSEAFASARRTLALTAESERTALDIDQAYLEAKIKELSGVVPVTIGGRSVSISERRSATGRANARAYLRQEYERLGFTVSELRYGSTLNPGVNFVAEKAGSEPGRFVLLTSHLDSVGNAGADDDGAGTVSNLAIAQALSGETLRNGLRVVAFDQEENGLVGSANYAKSLSDAGRLGEVVGVVNLEMTGFDSDNDGGFHAIDCGENTSADLTRVLTDVVARDSMRLSVVAACTNRSDHASFWRYDVPAIVISENFFGGDGNPCYHLACDKVDRLNFGYMARLTTAVARAAQALVVAP